jgi:hypothetical protein
MRRGAVVDLDPQGVEQVVVEGDRGRRLRGDAQLQVRAVADRDGIRTA